MKKLLLFVVCMVTALGASAQIGQGEKSLIIEGGAKSNPGRFMLGVQGRYNIIDHVRIAPEALFVFPKDKVTGLDVNVNVHYVFGLDQLVQDLSVYPLVGLSMQNGRYSGYTIGNEKHGASGATEWGFNLGGGVGYEINSESFLNLELKYVFGNADNFGVSVGYGFKF